MAGNRVAFVVAQQEVLEKIKIKTQWASLSYLSAGAAIIAMDHEDYFNNLINDVSQRREKLQDFLRNKNYTVLPTSINAVLIKFPSENEGDAFVDYLNSNNFVVRHGNGASNVGLDKSFVRIAVGTEKEIKSLQNVINNFK